MTVATEGTSKTTRTRTTCRICAESELDSVLDLGTQYLPNFVPAPDTGLPKAPLELVRCRHCGVLQLRHTVDRELLYRDYWYRSSINQTMRDALDDVVLTGMRLVKRGTWLDIGANDGYLLSKVPPTFTKIACEPARTFHTELRKRCEILIPDFFSGSHGSLQHKGDGYCDVITSVAMFYDVDDPNGFVSGIATSLSPHGIWINQLNDSPTMLKKNAFDAICHEHLTYYDIPALESLYRRHGLAITGITRNEVNGGSIRIVARRQGDGVPKFKIEPAERVTAMEAKAFAERIKRWKKQMQAILGSLLTTRGPLYGYGASTKGCVLLQYLGGDCGITAIADRNQAKHGTFMTGSWIPVVDEATMRKDKPGYVLVLPWAFRDEFVQREAHTMAAGTPLVFPLPNIEIVV